MRAWKAFFPKARIIGLDIHYKCFVDEDRIRTFKGCQTDRAVLARILQEEGGPLVMIDDGSHRPAHPNETFAILFPFLPDRAIYATEDMQTS